MSPSFRVYITHKKVARGLKTDNVTNVHTLLTKPEKIMTLEEALTKPTISVPDAGKLFFGLARNAAYDAAKTGDIQTIKVGGRIVVPVAPLAEKLGLKTTIGRTA
ncbi:hypothetical protein ACVI1N_000914 [Sinorhizobium medicae]